MAGKPRKVATCLSLEEQKVADEGGGGGDSYILATRRRAILPGVSDAYRAGPIEDDISPAKLAMVGGTKAIPMTASEGHLLILVLVYRIQHQCLSRYRHSNKREIRRCCFLSRNSRAFFFLLALAYLILERDTSRRQDTMLEPSRVSYCLGIDSERLKSSLIKIGFMGRGRMSRLAFGAIPLHG
jgi:hypothetical protein